MHPVLAIMIRSVYLHFYSFEHLLFLCCKHSHSSFLATGKFELCTIFTLLCTMAPEFFLLSVLWTRYLLSLQPSPRPHFLTCSAFFLSCFWNMLGLLGDGHHAQLDSYTYLRTGIFSIKILHVGCWCIWSWNSKNSTKAIAHILNSSWVSSSLSR